MKKILFILLLTIFNLYIHADIYWLILYDSNYMPFKSYVLNQDYPALHSDSIYNALFIGTIDCRLQAHIHYGSNRWDIDAGLIYLDPDSSFIVKSQYSFSEITGAGQSDAFDSSRLYSMLNTGIDASLSLFYDLHTDKYINSDYYTMHTDIPSITQYGTLYALMQYRQYTHQEEYSKALSIIKSLYEAFPAEQQIFSMYIIALLNTGDFYNANSELGQFYEQRQKDDFYYSIKTNILALSGNFKQARLVLEEGRTLYPESRMLQMDAYNFYSVTDTVRMKLIEEILLHNDSIYGE